MMKAVAHSNEYETLLYYQWKLMIYVFYSSW